MKKFTPILKILTFVSMLEIVSSFLGDVNSLLWGWFMIVVLVGTHIYTTIRTGFIQRRLGCGMIWYRLAWTVLASVVKKETDDYRR